MAVADDMKAFRIEVGGRLRAIRELRELDQSELAEKASVFTVSKLRQSTPSQIELGHRGMPPAQQEAFAKALGVDPAWFDPLITPEFDAKLAAAGFEAPRSPQAGLAGDLNRVSVLRDRLARLSPSLRRYVDRFKVPDEVVVEISRKDFRAQRSNEPFDEDNDSFWGESVELAKEKLAKRHAGPGAKGGNHPGKK